MWLALDTFGQDVDAAKVVKFLTAKGMACSVYAAFAFVMGLYGLGRSSDTSSSASVAAGQLALDLMSGCDAENSWCRMLRQGATATMEAWNPDEKPNLSWSHPWATAPATGIAHGFMGITAASPTYESVLVQPQVGESTVTASLTLPTARGFVTAAVDSKPGQSFELSLNLPANTRATVYVPVSLLVCLLVDRRPSPSLSVALSLWLSL